MLKLENSSGVSVTLLEMGGAIQSILVPDRKGKLADVVLGYDDPGSTPASAALEPLWAATPTASVPRHFP